MKSYAEEPAQRRRITVSRIGVAVLCAEVSQRLRGRVSEASQGNRRGGAKARAVVEASSAKAIVAPLRGRRVDRRRSQVESRRHKGVAEASRESAAAEAYQSILVMAICDALSSRARAAAMIGE